MCWGIEHTKHEHLSGNTLHTENQKNNYRVRRKTKRNRNDCQF